MFRGMVLRAVGVQPDVSVQRTPFHVKKGDVVLLCSDGLSRMVPDKLIAEIVYLERGNPVRMVDRLIEAAYEAGAVDNVTVEVVCVGELPQPAIPVSFMSDGGLSDTMEGLPETEETDAHDEEGTTTQDTSSAASTRSVVETREDDRQFRAGAIRKIRQARRWRLVAYVSSIVTISLLTCLAVMAFMWRRGRQDPEPMPVGPLERQTEAVREVAPPPATAPRPTSTATNRPMIGRIVISRNPDADRICASCIDTRYPILSTNAGATASTVSWTAKFIVMSHVICTKGIPNSA